ncbi:MAG: hypothetical protein GY953_57130 [bacterium]|nr:hypothetical protein [bacterium]
MRGHQSRGSSLVLGYDKAADRLQLHGGEGLGVDEYVRLLDEFSRTTGSGLGADPAEGFLFQEVVRQHSYVAERCGDPVGCVRVYVAIAADGPRILETVWKIPAPGNLADNFW